MRGPARPLSTIAAIVVVALAATESHAQHKRAVVDEAVRHASAAGAARQRVIVTHRPGAEVRVRDAFGKRGHRTRGVHRAVSAIAADIEMADLDALASNPDVEGISADAIVRSSQSMSEALTDLAAGPLLATLGAGLPKETGKGVGVAVIDSGIEATSDFGRRVKGFYDFTRGGARVKASDGYGHGTHVSGLIGGNGGRSGFKHRGIAPGVNLFVLKVLDDDGHGYTSDVIAAIEFAIDNRARLGIDIINLSLGHPIFEPAATDPLVRAVERASAAGLVVVTSAGNFGTNPDTGAPGYAGITSPGNAPSAITVGASRGFGTVGRADDRVAPYSSRGPTWYDGMAKPDILAPGDRLSSVAPGSSRLYRENPGLRTSDKNPYLTLSGTSMATAVATGVVALVIEAYRDGVRGNRNASSLTPNAVKAILQYTAIPLADDAGAPYDVLTQGVGGLNAGGALALANLIDPSIPPGSRWVSSGISPFTRVGPVAEPWAQYIVWGNQAAWGPTIFDNAPAWSQHIVWGSHIVWGTHIEWGDHIVWGNHIDWQDHIVWGTHIVWGAHIVWGNHIVWGDHAVDGSKGPWQ